MNGNALIIVIIYSNGTVPWMVIRRHFTKEAQVQSQECPCGFCGGQNESVTGLCPSTLSISFRQYFIYTYLSTTL